MSASETGFSSSRDIGTRRRCPTHSGERPKCHGHARNAHRSTLGRVVAGYHPPTRTYVYHQHDDVAAPAAANIPALPTPHSGFSERNLYIYIYIYIYISSMDARGGPVTCPRGSGRRNSTVR